MTMRRFNIKQNDTAPALKVKLLNDNGNLKKDMDLISSVQFHMMDRDENTVISKSGTIISEDDSTVAYDWDDGDTESVGKYRGEFELEYDNQGGTETFPNSGYIDVIIDEDIE